MNPNEEPYFSFLSQYRSKCTKASYFNDLSMLGACIQDEPYRANKEQLRAFLLEKQGKGASGTSLNRYKACYIAFFDFLADEDKTPKTSPFFLQVNPAIGIRGKKMHFKNNRPDPAGLDYEDRTRLIKSLIWDDTLHEKQMGLFIEFGIYLGMRVSEIQSLRWADLDLENEKAEWISKGNKPRVGYVPKTLRDHLTDYEAIMRKSGLESRWVFFNRFNLREFCHVSVFGNWCKILGKRADIKNLHPHLLRHTTAQWLIDNGRPVQEVKEVLGHENIATTQRYFEVNKSKIKSMLKNVMG